MKTTGRGVVLEVEGDAGLVMTPTGEFRWVPLGDQRRGLGQEVRFGGPERFRPSLRPALAAACVTLLLVMMVPVLGNPGPVSAYVSVDINPSLELAVDGRGRVVAAEGLDGGAAALLEAAGSLRGLPLDAAVDRLVRLAWDQGLLRPEGQNMIVVAGVPAALAQGDPLAWLEAAVLRVEERLRRDDGRFEGLVVAAVRAEAAVREEARVLGLTTGRYVVLLQAQEEGLVLEVEDVRGKPLAAAIEAAGGSAAQVAVTAKETAMAALADKFRERNQPLPPGQANELEPEKPPGPPPSPPGQAKRDEPVAAPPGPAARGERAAPAVPPGQADADRVPPPQSDRDQVPAGQADADRVPPGQANRDRVPPGQEKKDEDDRDGDRGDRIPPGQARKAPKFR